MGFSVLIGVIGIAVAYRFYVRRPEIAATLKARFAGPHRVLTNKYYVDELYGATVIRGTMASANGLWTFDRNVVDGAVNGSGWLTSVSSWLSGLLDKYIVDGLVNLVGSILQESSFMFRRLQTGLIQNYALLMLFGVFAFVSSISSWDGSRYESFAVVDPVHAAGRRRGADVREQAQRERHPLDREPLRDGRVPRVPAALVLPSTCTNPAYQFVERAEWIPSIGAWYYLGVDGFSALMILLTTLMGVIAILSSWTAITERVKEYYIFLLLLQTGMIGAFVSLDFLLFFLFWEVMLVPMYFLIGIWGSDRRLYSAIKFFLYTLVGSVVMLLGILALYFLHRPADRAAHVRHRPVPAARLRHQPAVVGVPGVLPGLRDQGADVPVPHVAARRAHRRADGRARSSWRPSS